MSMTINSTDGVCAVVDAMIKVGDIALESATNEWERDEIHEILCELSRRLDIYAMLRNTHHQSGEKAGGKR